MVAGSNPARPAIHTAVRVGYTEILKFLLENGADVNAKNSCGCTPLHVAEPKYKATALDELKELFKLLIQNGADVNAKNNDGESPLHKLAPKGYYNVVDLLVKKDADVDAQDKYGYTPLHTVILESCEYDRMVEILIINGADLYAQDRFCHTPLEIAKYRNYQQIDELIQYNIQFSLAHGCKDDNPVLKSSFTEKPDNESEAVGLAGQGEFGGE